MEITPIQGAYSMSAILKSISPDSKKLFSEVDFGNDRSIEESQKNLPALRERVIQNRRPRSVENNHHHVEQTPVLSLGAAKQRLLDSYLDTHNENQLKIFLDHLTVEEFPSIQRRDFKRFPAVIFSVESIRNRLSEGQRSCFSDKQRDAYDHPQKYKFFGEDYLSFGVPDARVAQTFQRVPPERMRSQLRSYWPPLLLGKLTSEQRAALLPDERAEIDRYLRECRRDQISTQPRDAAVAG